MKYISGFEALQINNEDLGTPGDWHRGCVDWNKPEIYESEELPFGNWGIREHFIPGPIGRFQCANHVRACLDLIATGFVGTAQGMRNAYIDDEQWTPIIFQKITLCRNQENWPAIDRFMTKEYGKDWRSYRETSAYVAQQ